MRSTPPTYDELKARITELEHDRVTKASIIETLTAGHDAALRERDELRQRLGDDANEFFEIEQIAAKDWSAFTEQHLDRIHRYALQARQEIQKLTLDKISKTP